MKKISLLLASVLLTGLHSLAHSPRGILADDRDLTGPLRPRLQMSVPLQLTADRTETQPEPGLTIHVLREFRGQRQALPNLVFRDAMGGFAARTDRRGLIRTKSCNGGTVRLEAALQDARIRVTNNGRNIYRLIADVPCQGLTRLIFREDSPGGQALGIWQIAQQGQLRLSQEVDMSFWRSPMTFVWPAQGDYYNGSVHITRGDAWDVVGHEMGHAIYDLGDIGAFGGGAHKIDECYSGALALSEGWASYFAAWISVDPADPDAKFEHMVPRRAPIRFENIPADVCKGPRNEWRVTGFFWDLLDLHNDGEISATPFRLGWDALRGRRPGSVNEAIPLLEKAGFDSRLLKSAWDLNFGVGTATDGRRR